MVRSNVSHGVGRCVKVQVADAFKSEEGVGREAIVDTVGCQRVLYLGVRPGDNGFSARCVDFLATGWLGISSQRQVTQGTADVGDDRRADVKGELTSIHTVGDAGIQ